MNLAILHIDNTIRATEGLLANARTLRADYQRNVDKANEAISGFEAQLSDLRAALAVLRNVKPQVDVHVEDVPKRLEKRRA